MLELMNAASNEIDDSDLPISLKEANKVRDLMDQRSAFNSYSKANDEDYEQEGLAVCEHWTATL